MILYFHPLNDSYHTLARGANTLAYLDVGQGAPVVFVHGNPTWSVFFLPLLGSLLDTHRCIVPDHIGMGYSSKPNDDQYTYRLQQRIDDLEALIDHVAPNQPVTLVVHDWGGMIGMGWASRHPERLARLVVLNTAAFFPPPGKKIPWQIRVVRNTSLGSFLVQGLNAFVRGLVWYCPVKRLPQERRDGYLDPSRSRPGRLAILRFVQDIPLEPSHPSYDLVASIDAGLGRFANVSTLICWGLRDFVFDKDYLAGWQQRFPHATTHAFADAGHLVLDDAGDRVAPLVRDFLLRDIPQSSSTNVAAPLAELARRQPDVPALIEARGWAGEAPQHERRWSFRALNEDSDRLARGLTRLGLKRGTRTVLMVPPSFEFYALTFALFKLGCVVVLIDPGMGVRNLGRCLAEAQPEAFLGVPKAHAARVVLRWARRTLRLFVTVGPRLFWGGWTLDRVRSEGTSGEPVLAPVRSEDHAAVLFTSGSTGVAKGAVYTHGTFNAQVGMLRELYGIEPGEIDLPTFPLFGLFAPALGMTCVLPEMDATRPAHVDPRAILGAVRHYGVTNMFGSPALLRRVGAGAPAGTKLPTLRRVISAGAPVSAPVIARFAGLLAPGVQVHTPYGATEALPVCSVASDDILREFAAETAKGKGVCVGRPVPGVLVKVLRIDRLLPEWNDAMELSPGTIGEVAVAGPMVTRSYCNNLSATAHHKIRDRARGLLWHRMGDVGYLDGHGRLWFCGRVSQRVVTATQTYFTIPCEGVFNVHPQVFRSALVGVPRNGYIEPEICIELDPQAKHVGKTTLLTELAALGARHDHTRPIRRFHVHPRFPVDVRHNAKIFREKLALWAARQAGGLVP